MLVFSVLTPSAFSHSPLEEGEFVLLFSCVLQISYLILSALVIFNKSGTVSSTMLDSSNWGIEWGCLSVSAIRCCLCVKRVRPFPQLERQVKHGKFCMTEGCCLQLLNKMQNDCCAPRAGPFRSFARRKNMKERLQVKYKSKALRLKTAVEYSQGRVCLP